MSDGATSHELPDAVVIVEKIKLGGFGPRGAIDTHSAPRCCCRGATPFCGTPERGPKGDVGGNETLRKRVVHHGR